MGLGWTYKFYCSEVYNTDLSAYFIISSMSMMILKLVSRRWFVSGKGIKLGKGLD